MIVKNWIKPKETGKPEETGSDWKELIETGIN
jgi:hypothetical protein